MRSVLDPKRHYRANDSTKNPKFFQIATVINGPADYYAKEDGRSVRKRKRVRNQTIVHSCGVHGILCADACGRADERRGLPAVQQEQVSHHAGGG
jgi:hypothetical protein